MFNSRLSTLTKSVLATGVATVVFGVGFTPVAVAGKPTTDTTTDTNTKTSGGGRKIG